MQAPIEARIALRHALFVVIALAAALAAVPWVMIAELDVPFGWLLESYGLVGFFTVAVGVWLWDRRTANSTGLLLAVVGLAEIVASFGNTDNRFLVLVGGLAAEAPIAALAHLVLAFPSGRLRDRSSRVLVAVHYAVSIGWQIPIYVLSPSNPVTFDRLQIAGHEDWVKRSNDLQALMSGALLVTAAVIVTRRWRAAPLQSQRRPLGIVYGYGIFVLLSFPLSSRVLRPQLEWNVYTLFGLQLAIVLGVPFVFGAALLSGGLARTVGVDELATWLAAPDDRRPVLRTALARALGDPSVEVRYLLDDGVVDDEGNRHPVPALDRPGATVVSGAGGEVAVIVYDPDLNEPGLVEAAGRVLALALERERLHAELVASREELRRSRLRIVEQAEHERRQIARDLHDGVQGRLVVAALHAGRLAADGADPVAVARLRDEIDTAITELRQLVQGVMPALLIDRGVVVAAEDLVDRMPVESRLVVTSPVGELPWPVASAAYFVLAEALANVVKHAQATQVEVTLGEDEGVLRLSVTDDGVGGAEVGGSGLRGVSDRVVALGGRLRISSEPGRGTRLEAELPCGS